MEQAYTKKYIIFNVEIPNSFWDKEGKKPPTTSILCCNPIQFNKSREIKIRKEEYDYHSQAKNI